MLGRALVTGSEGFTGGYVCSALRAAGWEVWGTGMRSANTQASHYITCELTQPEQVRALVEQVRPHVVIHLAGIAFVGHDDPGAFYTVNVIGTRNLLAALSAVPSIPNCVILASSANTYGNRTEGSLSENSIPDPANDYAVSKLAMEYMAKLWMDKLPIVITRPFNYTGVGQSESFLIPKIIKHFKERASVIELGNLAVGRDFSDVRDIARAYVALADKRPTGQAVNLCSGRSYSVQDVLDIASEISGHSLAVNVNPLLVRSKEVLFLRGDCTRLRHLIGTWQPTPFEETMRWMFDPIDG